MYEIYKKLLDERNVKTADVCAATGISQNVMSNWKKRGGNLSVDNAMKIALFFDVSLEYLMGIEETDKTPSDIRDEAQLNQLKANFLRLNMDDRRAVLMMVSSLLAKDEYKKDGLSEVM